MLDEEGQAELREALVEGTPPDGGMWSGPKVARWIEQKTGTERVHDQRGWEYLRKARMSLQVPRPSTASASGWASLSFLRVGEWLRGVPKATTRRSPFARLMAQPTAA